MKHKRTQEKARRARQIERGQLSVTPPAADSTPEDKHTSLRAFGRRADKAEAKHERFKALREAKTAREDALRARQKRREKSGFYDNQKGPNLAVVMLHKRAGHRTRVLVDELGKARSKNLARLR